jgi:GDP-L-fucose synthase
MITYFIGEIMVDRFLVAGSTGLVGRAIVRKLESISADYFELSSKDVDLKDYRSSYDYISEIKPSCIIDSAAKVGGIKANSEMPVDFLTENLQIQNNLMRIANELEVGKFIFLGSSCIYPRDSTQPIKEEYLMTGKLEETNSAYAIAKIAGLELIKAYSKQYNRQWISLMPTNIYGPFDNFDINTAHVIPALINKYVNAKSKNSPYVEIWGTGNARREFLHTDDLASAILFCVDNYTGSEPINIGYGTDIKISELAQMISSLTEYSGKTLYNDKHLEGSPQKLLDSSRIKSMGWGPEITLNEGIASTVKWYIENLEVKNNEK